MQKKWELLRSEEVYSCKMFKVRQDDVLLPNGRETKRQIVEHPGAVVILPKMQDGRLVLISQYRHAMGRAVLEFPAGRLEPGEEPLECAKREIKEEIGYAAAKWEYLGKIITMPGICTETLYCYVASDLRPEKLKGDEDEIIDTIPMTVFDTEQSILDGGIDDAKTICSFTRAKLRGLI